MIRELTSEIITMVKFATIQPLVSFVFNHESVKDNVVILIVLLMGFYFVTQIDINWLYHHVILRLYYNKVCSYSYNQVAITGERILRHGMYSSSSNIVTSSSFQAMWEYLQENRNKSVFSLKEWKKYNQYNDDIDGPVASTELMPDHCKFVIDQNWSLYLEKGIHMFITITDDKRNYSTFNGTQSEVDVEIIELKCYSYVKNVYEIKDFINDVTDKYIEKQKEKRRNKIYDYYLETIKEDTVNWNESVFESSKTMNNIFFDEKDTVMKHVNYFLDNKHEYDRDGIPYTLGICLHGPPGTGKTSFIKALANKTQRHIVTIPLNKVKQESDFYKTFMGPYKTQNGDKSYGFHEKILVLEDIDCMGDIVLEREGLPNQDNFLPSETDNISLAQVNSIVKRIVKEQSAATNKVELVSPGTNPLTLSFILNVIDGVREHSGRIIIITSNRYHKLDKALIRPGRVDITLEMKMASVSLIKEVFFFYYKQEIPKKYVKHLRSGVVSPCQLVNLRRCHRDKNEFLGELMKQFK
jgi:hypothetical protein